jgi:MoaA/NifB/PqqE/SkfB family radical SAM enzyme/SAM-dependent methyltransferase
MTKVTDMRGDQFFASLASRPPFSRMHPRLAVFFKDYLSNEKVVAFGGNNVVNTHLPPYPSRAFDKMVEQFNEIGDASTRRLFSVTWAVTNRCTYDCWHCYNAGRSQQDLPLETLKQVGSQLQELGAVVVTLSGGEPLLRDDLEEIVRCFDDSCSLNLNTTGAGLTAERAQALREAGLFAVGVSLDSAVAEEHDQMRGKKGAFAAALQAVQLAARSGLYPYIISLATREFLESSRFSAFMRFAGNIGALEVHLLEPCATGRLAGRSEVVLSTAERHRILDFQNEVARDESLPILSSLAHLESPEAFGCGAGLTHLYIDGSGEVCPCNLLPISFGNIAGEPVRHVLDKMGRFFKKPRPTCVGRVLGRHITADCLPTNPEVSMEICKKYLARRHSLPRFFKERIEAQSEVGQKDLRAAYDQIHEHYDQHWLKEAGKPTMDLIAKLAPIGNKRVYEAGCGTGFATALIAERLTESGTIVAVDLSEGMLAEARKRSERLGIRNVRFMAGDALEILGKEGLFDIVFSSWVLGYIPLQPFLLVASRALLTHGRVAFVVHKEKSPREPLEIFEEIVTADPSVLQKRVWFDFPRDKEHVEQVIKNTGLEVEHLWEGEVRFCYNRPDEVLEHLLKSGAGTAFYDAIDPTRRQAMEQGFLKRLATRRGPRAGYEVIHEYVACIAVRGHS